MPENVPEFSGFKPAPNSPPKMKLTFETERIVEQLRANKSALELLFSTHGVRPDLSVLLGSAISRLVHLDVQLQKEREGKVTP